MKKIISLFLAFCTAISVVAAPVQNRKLTTNQYSRQALTLERMDNEVATYSLHEAHSRNAEWYLTSYGADDDGNRYTVTMNPGNGYSSKSTFTQSSFQEALTLPACTCNISGWTFIGWSETLFEETTTKPTGLYAQGSIYVPMADVTLYAVYKKAATAPGKSGSYTLDYADTQVQSTVKGYGIAGTYVGSANDTWIIKAYQNNGMQINKGKNASIKVPDCPSAITSIVVTDATARVLNFSDTDYTGSNNPTVIASSESSTNATIDLSGKNVSTGYIYTTEGSTVIIKVVVNYGGSASATYATYPGGIPWATPTISFGFSKQNMLVGDTNDTFIASVTGSTGEVTYTSSNDAVATVGQKTGRVVAKEPGTTVITATVAAVEGVSKSATAKYTLTVAIPKLSSINVTTPPSKTTYLEGETFKKDGMVVTAIYENGYKEEIKYEYKLDPTESTPLTPADKEIKVSFTEAGITQTATVPITVNTAPRYTVTFNAGSGTCSTLKLTEEGYQSGITLPIATGINSEWKFAGWATSATTATATRPTLFVAGANYKPTADITLYAVYSMSESTGGNGNYELVTVEPADWSGNYLIAYSNSIFADGRTSGTAGIGSASTIVNPGDNLEGNTVKAEWGDTYHFTLSAVDGGYVMQTQDGVYNYRTANSNGIDTSNNIESAQKFPIVITFNSSSDISLTSKISGTKNPVFHYNTSGKIFRFYANGGQSSVYLYRKQGSIGNVTYDSSPSGAELKEPVIAFATSSNKSMLVGDNYTNLAKVTGSTGAITYSSSSTKVATVDSHTGKVTAVGIGESTITAYVDAVPGVSKGASVSYKVTITMPALTGITVLQNPTKTTYGEGELLHNAGLQLKATYANGYSQTITEGFTTLPAEESPVAANTTSVSVSYTEGGITQNTSYSITVGELPKYAVTFIVEGKQMVVTQDIANTGVIAPEVADAYTLIDGNEVVYTFAGWATKEVASETINKPTMAALTDGKYLPKADITLYAVFTRKTETARGFTLNLPYKDKTFYVGNANTSGKRFDSSNTEGITLYYSNGYLWYLNADENPIYAYFDSTSDIVFTSTKSNVKSTWEMNVTEEGVATFKASETRYLALNQSSTGIIRAYGSTFPNQWSITYTGESSSISSNKTYTCHPALISIADIAHYIESFKSSVGSKAYLYKLIDRILEK